MSINGKITKGSDDSVMAWTSKADQKFFKQILADNSAYIMGSRTYDVVKPKPSDSKLRIVLTRNPDNYVVSEVPGQIEFSDNSPNMIIDKLADKGYDSVLILGGSQIYSLFLEEDLITDVYITLEPLIFGHGKDLLNNIGTNLSFKLVSSEKMNEQGTLLLHYQKPESRISSQA